MMVATASIKMDELLTSWLGSDAIYETVMRIIEQQKETSNINNRSASPTTKDDESSPTSTTNNNGSGGRPPLSPNVSMQEKPHFEIPPFYRNEKDTLSSASNTNNNSLDNPQNPPPAPPKRRLHSSFSDDQTWDGIYMTNREGSANVSSESIDKTNDFDRDSIATDVSLTGSGGALNSNNNNNKKPCIAIQAKELFQELGVTPSQHRKLIEQEGRP